MPECKVCKFSCKYQSEFNRHLNSKKHVDNCNSKHFCAGCSKQLSNDFSKKRHEKNCKKIIQNIKNNINTQNNAEVINNITNNNNINITIPESKLKDAETIAMTFEELLNKKSTNCIQRLILNQMNEESHDLMDYVDIFDKSIENKVNEIIEDHNKNCSIINYVEKTNENGENTLRW